MKAAVIGCGRIGAEPSSRLEGKIPSGWLPISHVESLLAIPQIDSIALCDLNIDLLKNRVKHYGLNIHYNDYQTLIKEYQPDIVTVATRTPSKIPIVQFACENGVKGVYIEKPLANSISEVKKCLEIAKKNNVKLGYGVNRRYHAVYRKAKELILSGEIGEIIEVVVEHGESQLLWAHPHTMDLILFFLGKTDVNSVQASIELSSLTLVSQFLVDSDPIVESAFFKFGSDKSAVIGRGKGLNIRLAGKKGNMVVHANGSYIQINKSNENQFAYFQHQNIIHCSCVKSATVEAITQLIESVSLNGPSPIDFEALQVGTRMLIGCVWSAINGGRVIPFNSIPEELFITGKYRDLYA